MTFTTVSNIEEQKNFPHKGEILLYCAAVTKHRDKRGFQESRVCSQLPLKILKQLQNHHKPMCPYI